MTATGLPDPQMPKQRHADSCRAAKSPAYGAV